MWENDRPGNRASRKRSTRMLSSSGVTTTVCTLVGSCSTFAFTGSDAKEGCFFGGSSRRFSKDRGGFPPGRWAGGRPACTRSSSRNFRGARAFPERSSRDNVLLMRRLMGLPNYLKHDPEKHALGLRPDG